MTISWAIRYAKLPNIKDRVHVCLFVKQDKMTTYAFCGAFLMNINTLENFQEKLNAIDANMDPHILTPKSKGE